MYFNYHTHTKRCNHAVGSEREYVESAIQNGLKILGISDHAPYLFPNTDYYSYFRMQVDELQEYADTVRALQKEYEKDIRILLGFELEYYPDFHAEEMQFLKQVSPDYLILGQHLLNNELDGVISSKLQTDEGLAAYVTQVLSGLSTGDFLYLAHPDLPGYRFSKEAIDREYRRLCEGAKRMNIPLEINLLGMRAKRPYPDKRFFKIAAEVGNEIIIGSDAHDPKDVADPASEKLALDMVSSLGLKLIQKPLLD